MPEIIVLQEHEGERLDSYLASNIPDMSRSAIRRIIDEGCVTVDGANVKASHKVSEGDTVHFELPAPKPTDIQPEEISLDIVYEDDDIIVINKPKGMVVHPAPGSPAGTVVNALLAHSKGLSAVGGVERPGVVHRLDKDTSGLMVVAKNDNAHHSLQKQIQARTAERKYLLLVWGNPRFEQAVVDAPIGRHPTDRKKMAVIETSELKSRPAVTEFRVKERFGPFTLLEAKLQTGRTHQVRVHIAYAGHPVVGDPVYSGGIRLHTGEREFVFAVNKMIDDLQGQALHAYSLSFNHPVTGERLEFTVDLPLDMMTLVEYLRKECGK
ncbi:MAG: RluA family pseudouridine synthase [Armatimonadota bacterium]